MLLRALAALEPLSTQVGQVTGPAGQGTGYGELLVVSFGLVAVVGVLVIVMVRGLGGRGPGRRGSGLLEVIARQPLEPRRSLYVVRAGTRTLLVGTSELGVTMLTELEGVNGAHGMRGTDGLPGANASPQPGGFAELVRAAALRWRERRQAGQGARSSSETERETERKLDGEQAPAKSGAETQGASSSGLGST